MRFKCLGVSKQADTLLYLSHLTHTHKLHFNRTPRESLDEVKWIDVIFLKFISDSTSFKVKMNKCIVGKELRIAFK